MLLDYFVFALKLFKFLKNQFMAIMINRLCKVELMALKRFLNCYRFNWFRKCGFKTVIALIDSDKVALKLL